MAEARDRLSRPPVDLADTYAQWLSRNRSIYIDPPEQVLQVVPDLSRTPARQRAPTALGFGATGVVGGGGLLRSSLRTPRTGNGRGRIPFGFTTPARENTPPAGSSRRRRGRSSNSVLPSWYPRTPLQDISAVVRAIERRRARLVENDGQHTEGQIPQGRNILDQYLLVPGAQLEHGVPVTPYSAVRTKQCPPPSVGRVQKIIREATNTQTAEGEFLTPQKKLLNSIDTVEKVVMEELQRLKRTPSAKKAEREKRVRTLMSMR